MWILHIFLKTQTTSNIGTIKRTSGVSYMYVEANKRKTWRSWLVTFHSFYVVAKTQLKWKWRDVKMSLKISFALLVLLRIFLSSLKKWPKSHIHRSTSLSETLPLIKLCCRDSSLSTNVRLMTFHLFMLTALYTENYRFRW